MALVTVCAAGGSDGDWGSVKLKLMSESPDMGAPLERSARMVVNLLTSLMTLLLSQNPGGHGALVLHDGGFERVDEGGAEACGVAGEVGFGEQEPSLTVGHAVEVWGDRREVHADAGAEANEEQAAGTEDTPQF